MISGPEGGVGDSRVTVGTGGAEVGTGPSSDFLVRMASLEAVNFWVLEVMRCVICNVVLIGGGMAVGRGGTGERSRWLFLLLRSRFLMTVEK